MGARRSVQYICYSEWLVIVDVLDDDVLFCLLNYYSTFYNVTIVAGLAVSQGIVSSSIVMVSFIWGNLVFKEPVQSELIAYFAVTLIMGGLYGMSYYSSSEEKSELKLPSSSSTIDEDEGEKLLVRTESEDSIPPQSPIRKPKSSRPLEVEPSNKLKRKKTTMTICGASYSRRDIGLASALMCGLWGGSCLAPMHYAPSNITGLGYVISFSVGALTVTIGMWIGRFLFYLVRTASLFEAYELLPSFHLRVMWASGAAAGGLWSMGNVGSILAVKYLGQAVGYGASQSALLISGMWGIFYFKEVKNPYTIGKWFFSAAVTITGILLLGYESSV